ncbi:hypothetical protein, partial [Klebsiella quasipneumoniae]|uniref:hypothetical protein n=1 Tax=Klebsiella quasipneumoniae TaxID=1463165 RepID=UPI00272F6561
EIVSGIGGNLSNPTDPNSEFTGNHGETYTLSYTVSNACDTVSDMLTIAFSPYPTMPDAGPDMTGLTDTTVTLQGNQAVTGTGV